MKKIGKYVLTGAALCCCAVSCANFEEIPAASKPAAGEQAAVSVRFGIETELAPDGSEPAVPLATRVAPDMNDAKIHGVWVFQFDGTGDDALLVQPPYYIGEIASSGSATMQLKQSDGEKHLLLFAANVPGGAEYNWGVSAAKGTRSTLEEVCGRYMRLLDEQTTWGGADGAVIMSGSAVTVVDPDVAVGGVALTRSLAKIELTLSIDPAKAPHYSVVALYMRNVSRRIDIFDRRLAENGRFDGLYPVLPDVFDYEPVYNASEAPLLTAGAGERTFVWYVPRNMRGTVPESISKYTKNSMAPAGATYFEVVAKDDNGAAVLYRVYTGANEENDFNVVPNRRYHTKLTIEGDGGERPVDKRIEQYANVMFDGSNNAFLINPSFEGMPARSFSVPVGRVNEYWGSDLPGFGDTPANVIGGGDEWRVYLLWQDHPDMVRPAATADANKHITISKDGGAGTAADGDGYFTITVPHGVPRGNFVVALRKGLGTASPILWSWHFWVTDYAPDPSDAAIQKERFVYPCSGGQVERYVSQRFGYSLASSKEWTKMEWSANPTPSASLASGVVMDRHIGALVGGRWSADPRENGLFYQFGRKDPFPADINLYDINGTQLKHSSSSFPEQRWNNTKPYTNNAIVGNRFLILQSVKDPMSFTTRSDGDWSQLPDNMDYAWLDPRSDKQNYLTKSIYDPCPAGWRMMPVDVWSDFAHETTVNNISRGLGFERGAYYYPYIEEGGSYPVKGVIFYAGMWKRDGAKGTLEEYGTKYAIAYSSKPSSNKLMHSLDITGTSVNNNHKTLAQSSAVAVRCASDEKLP